MVNQYFNPALFTVNATGTYGNAPRDMLANSGLFDIDVGVIKNTLVTERINQRPKRLWRVAG